MDTLMKFIPSLDLGVIVMKEVIKRANVKPEDVDEMNYGACILAEMALESDCPARQASIIAGFPAELLSNTMDRACCSSLTTMRVSMWGHPVRRIESRYVSGGGEYAAYAPFSQGSALGAKNRQPALEG